MHAAQTDDWATFADFARKYLASLPVAASGLNAGVVQFATDAVVTQPLTGDAAQLLASVAKLQKWAKGKTNMDKAVDAALAEFAARGACVRARAL